MLRRELLLVLRAQLLGLLALTAAATSANAAEGYSRIFYEGFSSGSTNRPLKDPSISRVDLSLPAVCDPGEEEIHYLAGVVEVDLGTNQDTLRLVDLATCRPTAGQRRILLGSYFTALSEGTQVGSCTVDAIFEFQLERHFALAAVGCTNFSQQVIEFEWNGATGGNLALAFGAGTPLGDGSAILGFTNSLDFRYNGSNFVATIGYQDVQSRQGVAFLTRNPGWSASIAARNDTLMSFPWAPKIEIDCDPTTTPGDGFCPAAAAANLSFVSSTMQFGTYDSYFDGGGTLALVGDPAPGLPGETFSGFLGFNYRNHAVGYRRGYFTGFTNTGTNGLWDYDTSSLGKVIVQGEAIPDSLFSYGDATDLSVDKDEFSALLTSIGGAKHLVADTPFGLVGFMRQGVDLWNGAEITDLRGSSRMRADDLAYFVSRRAGPIFSDWATTIVDLEQIEVLTDGASTVYGADAVAGVVNIVPRAGSQPYEVSSTAPPSGEDFRSATFDGSGGLQLGTLDSEIWDYDRIGLSYSLRWDTGLGVSLDGLSYDGGGRLFATNTATLYEIDTSTGVGTSIGAFADPGQQPIGNIRGLTYYEPEDEIWAVRTNGEIHAVNLTNAQLTLRYQIDGLPNGVGVDSIALGPANTLYGGLSDGRLVAYPLPTPAQSAQARAANVGGVPILPLVVIGDTPAGTLAGLALMVPEPGAGASSAAALAFLCLARARGRRLARERGLRT